MIWWLELFGYKISKKKDTPGLNRRRFVKSAGVMTTGLSVASGLGRAQKGKKQNPIRLRGSLSNPVSRNQIIKKRKKFVKNSNSTKGKFGAIPSASSAVVLAYNFFIDTDGTPREQFLTANPAFGKAKSGIREEEGEVEALERTDFDLNAKHAKADAWIADPPTINKKQESVDLDSTVTTSSTDQWSDWDHISSIYTEHESAPYGVIIYDLTFKREPSDNAFALDVGVELESGKNRVRYSNDSSYNERWQNKEGFLTQNWNQDQYTDLQDRYPRTNKSNEATNTSITLGADSDSTFGASVTKTYSQPETEVLEKTSKIDDIARHHMVNAPNSDPAKFTCFYNPSSISTVGTSCSGSGFVDMVEADFVATWGDTNFLGQWVPETHSDNVTFTVGEYCSLL